MYLNIYKFFPILFLLLVFLVPKDMIAQSNADQILNRYEKGEILQPTAVEKQIISEYLDSMQPANTVRLIRDYSPDAIIFEEDFTGQVLPTGWTNVDNIASGQVWEFDNPGGRNITGSFDSDFAILDSDNYGSGGTQDATLTTVVIDASSATTVILGFDQQFRSFSGSFGVLEISNDGTTWTQLDSISADTGYPNPPAYTEYDVTAYAAGESTVYVRWTYVGSWGYWWAIDNVVVYEPDPIPNPAVLVSPNDGGTDIDVNTDLEWSSGGGSAPTGYRINFGTDNPPTNIENNTDLGLVTTYTPASQLAYNTTYYWEIIPYNGAGDATGTVVWSFTTMADPTISTFPYSENFDTGSGTTPPTGWMQDPNNVEDWEFTNEPAYAGPDHTSGSGMVAYVDDSTPYDNPSNLLSPPFDITGLTAPTMTFWYWIGAGNAGPSYLNVDVSTDGGATWIDSVITALVENNQWDQVTIDLTSYSSTALQFRFRGYENLSGFNCDIGIDDFSVFDNVTPPACAVNVAPPDGVDSVSVLSNLDWASGGGGPTGYLLSFGTDNPPTNIENGTDLGDVTTYDPASNLNYSTTYYWQVIAYNENGSATGCAVWSFTTEADPTITTFPWSDDLETPGEPETPYGWTQDTADDFDWTFDAGGTPSSLTGPSIDHNPGTTDGTYGFTESSTNYENTANIMTPPLDLTALSNPTFSFWYHMYGSSMGTLSVDYSTDGGGTWTNGWSLSGDQGDVWYNAEVVLPTDANLVRFSGLTGTNFYSDMAFDDITLYDNVSPPNCALNVSPPDGEDSVNVFTELDWADGGGGTEGYLIYFGTDNPPTNIENGTDLGDVTTYTPSASLSTNTTYYWQIIPYNVNGNATGCAVWSFETYPDAPLSGTFTVGLTAFQQAYGKEVYFEDKTRTLTIDLNGPESYLDLNSADETKKGGEIINNNNKPNLKTVTHTYKQLMEDGKEFNPVNYLNGNTRGIYPTITEAINDLNLRGVGGPVTFLLVDSDYPNETYPLLIGTVGGTSSTNTITIKPGPGVVTQIPGAPDQPTSTFQLGGADYVIVDGSNTDMGTSQDLTINAPVSSPAFHFYGGADNNVVKNTVFTSLSTSTGSGTFLFGSGASGDFNIVENCTIENEDTSSTRNAIGVYMFSSNSSTGNQVLNCNITGFDDYGMYLRGAPSMDHVIMGNMIDQETISTNSSIYGIRVDGAGCLIDGNYILNLNSTSSTSFVRGFYYYGTGSPMNVILQNNVFSLGGNTVEGTIRGIDYWGNAPNSFEAYYNTVFINGTDAPDDPSQGLLKRADADVFKAYNNAIYNSRSNGTGTDPHHGVYISNINFTTTFDLNYNDYFTDGTGGILGYYDGTDYSTLLDWQTATGQDANSMYQDPDLVSETDLRPNVTSPLIGAATPIAGISLDILGDTRDATNPTIGAYEMAYIMPIAAPTDLLAAADTNKIELFWQDNSANEDGFYIERKLGDTLSTNPFELIDSVFADVSYYKDSSGLAPDTTYTYRVQGYNQWTTSPYSNMAQGTTPIPVELTTFAASISDRSVILNWTTATETNNQGFQVQRKIKDKWEDLSFINGGGTTTEATNYSFTDQFKYTALVGVVEYRLRQVDFNGSFAYSDVVEVDVDFAPKEYTLYQNYPNPFNPSTTIKYALPFQSEVKVAIYNLLGEVVEVVVDGIQESGYYDVAWNASNLASGIYIYNIQATSQEGTKNFSAVKKMILIK